MGDRRDLRIGVPCDEADPATLAAAPKPLIAHFRTSPSVDNPAAVGHYVVVLRANERSVTVLDATLGQINQMKTEMFVRFFSGHVLASETPPNLPQPASLTFAAAVILSPLFAWWVRAQRSRTGILRPRGG